MPPTPAVHRSHGELYIEEMSCERLAQQFGTPLYAYSRRAIEHAWRAYDDALGARPHLVCYAMKANSNLAILDILARLGSGFDIVSVGELERVRAVGGAMSKVVFSGVGKRRDEMATALEAGIRCFNVESESEITVLAEVAASHGVVAPVSIRVNPDVDAQTHPYISTGLKENKFGIEFERARAAYHQVADNANLAVVGMDCHIGSQLTTIEPYTDALRRLISLSDELQAEGIAIDHLDLGGGQGIRYRDEQPLDLDAWARAMDDVIGDRSFEIIVEPGRSIVGNAGLLLTTVNYLKHNDAKNFAVVDAAMNDLIRPALYSAWQDIVPVHDRSNPASDQLNVSEHGDTQAYDVVGPVCESGDFLGKDRPLSLEQDDLLAVLSAGAYSFCMSSNYNSRPRPAEVVVDGDRAHCVRQRETIASLFADEAVLP
jgi:diaminopimelate decarboxylase